MMQHSAVRQVPQAYIEMNHLLLLVRIGAVRRGRNSPICSGWLRVITIATMKQRCSRKC
jgi:hypothetical protein